MSARIDSPRTREGVARRGLLATALLATVLALAIWPRATTQTLRHRALAPHQSTRPIISDARRKTAFREVDGEQLLAKLRAMPVRSWQYKSQTAAVRHVGPTAQDFRLAFAMGDSDTTIASVDADGVALAAARALESRTRTLRTENAALREELRAVRTAAMAARRDVAALWAEVAALRRDDAARSHHTRTAASRAAENSPLR